MLGRLLVTACIMGGICSGAVAQGAFPAPLPNQSGGVSPFPAPSPLQSTPDAFQNGAPPFRTFSPAQGAAGTAELEDCRANFAPLRQDAERRAKLIRTAGQRKASAREACDLITRYIAAEKLLVDYVTTRQSACNIPDETLKQLKANQSRSQQMMMQVCARVKDPPPSRFDLRPAERPFRFDLAPPSQPRLGILHISTPP